MAVGKEIGNFDMKSTSVTLEPGKGGSVRLHINFEGVSTGDLECEAIATMTVDSEDGKDGDYRISARCFLSNGEIMDANGHGKTTYGADHNWDVAGITEMQGHRGWAIRGDINLRDRTFVGKMYERI